MERAIVNLDRQRRECQDQIRLAARGELERGEMLRLRSYSNVLWLSLLGAGQKLAALREGVEERRRGMVKARRDVRALEILREKALRQWKKAAAREERRVLDDLQLAGGLLAAPTKLGGEAQ